MSPTDAENIRRAHAWADAMRYEEPYRTAAVLAYAAGRLSTRPAWTDRPPAEAELFEVMRAAYDAATTADHDCHSDHDLMRIYAAAIVRQWSDRPVTPPEEAR